MDRSEELTRIINDLGARPDGDSGAFIAVVYDELRRLSAGFLSRERVDHTLQPTALVHEAYIALAGREAPWADRAHFLRAAAKTMRHILINHAHAHGALKRGGGAQRLTLDEGGVMAATQAPAELLALDDAMRRLAERDPLKAQIVELRCFGGCTIDEAAAAVDLSRATVERHWRFARAWLRAELGDEAETCEGDES